MIKIICNACGEDIEIDNGFLAEVVIQQDLQLQQKVKKVTFHICKDCYENNIKNLWKTIK